MKRYEELQGLVANWGASLYPGNGSFFLNRIPKSPPSMNSDEREERKTRREGWLSTRRYEKAPDVAESS